MEIISSFFEAIGGAGWYRVIEIPTWIRLGVIWVEMLLVCSGEVMRHMLWCPYISHCRNYMNFNYETT